MKFAVLGTGMVGRSLSVKLIELGYEVVIGTRNVEETLAVEQPDHYGNRPFRAWQAEHPKIILQTFAEAAQSADRLIVCTPGLFTKGVLEKAGFNNVNGKLLIDVTNGLDFRDDDIHPALNPVNTDSIAEQLQRAYPDAKVIKAVNTVDHELMVNPTLMEGNHTAFLCGDDEEAKSTVKNLLQRFGWKSDQLIDLGGIIEARAMEMYAILWWRLFMVFGTPKVNVEIRRCA